MESLPYEPRSAIVRNFGSEVVAVWTASPEMADKLIHGDDDAFDRLVLNPHNEIEMIARIRRVHKRDGYEFSGWLIMAAGRSFGGGEEYAGPNKRAAMTGLRREIANYFAKEA